MNNDVNRLYVFLLIMMSVLIIILAVRYENALHYITALETRNETQYNMIQDYKLMIDCYSNCSTDENY